MMTIPQNSSGSDIVGHPTSAMAVANWFIAKNRVDPQDSALDQMKLYKLVYYANAWYLGNTGRELFSEDIEAWPHGPVIRNLYTEFSVFKREQITREGKELKLVDGRVKKVVPSTNDILEGFYSKVWDIYKIFTGIQLSNLTHDAGEPWTLVAQSYSFDLSSKPTIPSEIIKDCFAKKIRQRSA